MTKGWGYAKHLLGIELLESALSWGEIEDRLGKAEHSIRAYYRRNGVDVLSLRMIGAQKAAKIKEAAMTPRTCLGIGCMDKPAAARTFFCSEPPRERRICDNCLGIFTGRADKSESCYGLAGDGLNHCG